MVMDALRGHPHRYLHRYLHAAAEAREQQRQSGDSAVPAERADPETAGPAAGRSFARVRGRLAPPRSDRPEAAARARPDGQAAKIAQATSREPAAQMPREQVSRAPVIEVRGLRKSYGTVEAVAGVDLEVHAGEVFAFLGPNGAGKTTTIKMLCGLLFPTTGVIRIAGFDLEHQGEEARQRISYVPDTPFLYEKLTGREVLRFIAGMYHMPASQAAQRIDAMIELFSLESFVDDLTQNYSHGMRQRTVFAAALLHEPMVLIVDEPTVGLDPRSIRLLKDVLRNETKRGATVFLSTHSLDIAQELSDRIGVISQGKLIGCGTLDELRLGAELNGTLEEVFLKMTEEETPPKETGIQVLRTTG
jgi:ABC-2 type transport system ATP-binding protein